MIVLREKAYTDFSWVTKTRFSPDGRHVVACYDNEIALWEVKSRKRIKVFQGHSDLVWDVTFSPNMRHLLSASDDGTIRLWDVGTGKPIRQFAGNKRESRNVAFSPDGRRVAAACFRSVHIWNRDSGALQHSFDQWPDVTGSYDSLFFSPDGKSLSASGSLGVFHTWSLDSGRLVRPLAKPDANEAGTAKRSAKGDRIVLGRQKSMSVWDAKSGRRLWSVRPTHAVNGYDLAISPDGRLAVHSSGSLVVWDVESGKPVWKRNHPHTTDSVNFSPDGEFLVTGGRDGSIRIWKLPIKILKGRQGR